MLPKLSVFVFGFQKRELKECMTTLEVGLTGDINSQGRIPPPKELGQFLEIHGSCGNYSIHKDVLKHADHLPVVDDSSISHLSELGEEFLESIKTCWLEMCSKVPSIVGGEAYVGVSEKLDFLYLGDLSSFQSRR